MPYTHAAHSSGHTFLAILGIAMLGFVAWEVLIPEEDLEATAPTRISAPPREATRAEPEVDIPPPPPHAERAPGTRLFKCVSRGRVGYSDSPCPEGAKTIVVDATPAAHGVDPVRTMARPSLPEPAPRPAGVIAARPAPGAEALAQCQRIDEEVRLIDARSRQYHTSEEGGWLAEKRRQAMDRRYALGCNGA
ncbi:hypothetical protein [Niveibacterium terrae]|uniref:hypothetical protein n=1 Tax=Niveibacterium terrae TaxID=3373598 RepID=UPI003A926E03